MIAEVLIVLVIGIFFGSLVRVYAPFWRKVKEGQLAWNEFDATYLKYFIEYFIAQLIVLIPLVSAVATELYTINWFVLLIGGLVAGYGGQSMFNEFVRYLPSLKDIISKIPLLNRLVPEEKPTSKKSSSK